MKIFTDLRQARLAGPSVLTIGNFDGLHRGHQALLQQMQQAAHQLTGPNAPPADTVLLTFAPHPLHLLRPDLPFSLLTTPLERLELAAIQGISCGIIHPFTLQTAQIEPAPFLELLVQQLGMAVLVTGPDFALGHNRSGDLPLLNSLGTQLGFTVAVVDPVARGLEPVRSSRTRTLLRTGDVAGAASLLGRPYRVTGWVETGDQRGRQVGIPTANLRVPPEKLLPADGVYVTRTAIASFDRVSQFNSVTNIGVRPTVDGVHRRIESHLLDFPPANQVDDLYGRALAVDFLAHLRGELRFASIDALVSQIHADITQARAFFARSEPVPFL